MSTKSDGSRGKQAESISIAFTVLAGIIVLTRLYTRFFLVQHFPIEEYLITLAMVRIYGPHGSGCRTNRMGLDLLDRVDYYHSPA
jgi:hypothetical protein